MDNRRSEPSELNADRMRLRHSTCSRQVRRSIKPVIVAAVACLAVGACTEKSIGPAHVAQGSYQGWSCDQLNQEVARTDDGPSEAQKNAIERVMIKKNCIHPLAAETE
jgi:hypothetical protein